MSHTKLCFLLPLVSMGCAAGSTDSGDSVVIHKATKNERFNLQYAAGNNFSQRLDLFLPPSKQGEPLLIFIHGGAWVGGDKSLYSGLGGLFCKKGIAVALVNYRLSRDPKVVHPSHVQDTALAYAWLVQNASKYGYDAAKIFVSGHSAGAHNAAMMATGDFLKDAHVPVANYPAGFIGLEGIYDLAALNNKFPTYKDWFIAKAFGSSKNWPAASPTLRPVVIRSPWLVIQSTTDSLVDVTQAQGFVDHLKKANVKVTQWEKDGGDHDQIVTKLNYPQDPVAEVILNFIGS